MADDLRDFRVRIDLDFDPANEGVARGLYLHALNQMAKAVNINPSTWVEEKGYVELERDGHRIGVSCDIIEKQEVP